MSILLLSQQSYMLSKPFQLIGIVGHANTGKDSIAEYISNSLSQDVWIHPFAWFLKGAAAEAFGIPFDAFINREQKENKDPVWGVSPREIAQYVGTEMFRELDSDFWIYRLKGHLEGRLDTELNSDDRAKEGDVIVIPDVRFENEVNFILCNGGQLIHLTRPVPEAQGNVGIEGHASEAGISSGTLASMYHIHNSGTLEELYLEVDKFIDTQLTHLNY